MNVSRLLATTIALVLLLMVFNKPASAQFTSGLTGTVTDQSGAAISGAKILVTNQDTRVTRSTNTADNGDFRITSLPGATYTVEVEQTGFKTWVQKDLQLESNQVKSLHPTLALPNETVSVDVTAAEVAAIETDKSNTSREIADTTIHAAPLLGRNIYTSLIALAPGVTGSGLPAGGALGSGSANNDSFEQEAGYQINAAGQRQENNQYDVDGSIAVSASRDGVVNLSPEPDFIQAVRISGATIDASKGRYSGAYVQVFTKPGTNELHGSLSEFHTNNTLTARTEFQYCSPGSVGCRAIPAFRRNEFGGTIGGPIIKNKLFAFGGLFILRSSNATTLVSPVETPQFAQFVQQTFPNNLSTTFLTQAPPGTVPINDIVTVGQLQATQPGFYPESTAFQNNPDLPAFGTAIFPLSLTHNAYQWHARVDYNVNDSKDRLFFDWFRTYSDQLQADPRPIYRVKVPNNGFFAKLDWTHAFSPRLLNDASFTWIDADGSNPSAINNQSLPNVNISEVSGYNQWGPAGWVHQNYSWHDVLTWTHGSHTISAGGDIDRHHDDDKFTSPLLRPTFGFANLLDFAQDQPFSQDGPAMQVSNGALASDLYQILRWVYGGAFVQDDWKVTHRFTLNLGLRYDYFGHWGTYYNSHTPFPFFSLGSGSDFASQIASGSMSVRGGKSAYVTNNRPQGWGPRIGFAWDVLGDGKTSLRGGYGLFFNNVADGSWSFPARANPPTWANPSFSALSPDHPFSYALGDSTGNVWPIPPGITFQTNAAGGLVGLPVQTSGLVSNLDQPRTHVFMLSLQRELGHGLIAEADYNGSHSTNLYVQTDVNRFPGDLILNQGTQTRLNPNFGAIIFGRTIGVADGHYGTLMLSKRFSHSWQVRGIYTFGKATDDTSSNDNGTDNGEAIFNPLNIQAQHGLADYNVARRFTADSVVEVPSGFFKNGFMRKVLGGWRMSNILVLQSGLPFSVFSSAPFNPILDPNGNVIGLQPGSGDFNADGYAYDLPNAPAAGVVHTANRSDFLKGVAPASAFPIPALGQQGNLGRNSLIGPGLANINTEFAKVMRWERFSLEFRADVFNLFNRVNLTQPDGDLSSSLFGQSTGQNLPRSWQFGLHLDF